MGQAWGSSAYVMTFLKKARPPRALELLGGLQQGLLFRLFKGDVGSFGDHFGTILGTFWDHFGTILGPFWDDFGTILDTILGPFWIPFWDIDRAP